MCLPNARGTIPVTCHLSQRFITCSSEDNCYSRNTILLQAEVRPQPQTHQTVMFSQSSPLFSSLAQSSGVQLSKGKQRLELQWGSMLSQGPRPPPRRSPGVPLMDPSKHMVRKSSFHGQQARKQLRSRPRLGFAQQAMLGLAADAAPVVSPKSLEGDGKVRYRPHSKKSWVQGASSIFILW